MARVTRVTKARKDQGPCGKCREEIRAGSPYLHWSFRYGGKHRRCTKPGCAPKPSDTTSNEKVSRLLAIQEGLEEIVGNRKGSEDLVAALNDAGSEAREVSGEYEEGAQNIEMGFGHETEQSTELQETGERVEEWADALEEAASEIEDFEQGEEDADEAEPEDREDEDAFAERCDDRAQEALESFPDV